MIKAEILTVAGPYIVPLRGTTDLMQGAERITKAIRGMRENGEYLLISPNADQLEVLRIEEQANPILHIRVFDDADLQLEKPPGAAPRLSPLRAFSTETQYLGASCHITGYMYETDHEGRPYYYYLPEKVNGCPWGTVLSINSLLAALTKALRENVVNSSEFDIVPPIPELETPQQYKEYLMDYASESENGRHPKVLKPTARAAFDFAPGKYKGVE